MISVCVFVIMLIIMIVNVSCVVSAYDMCIMILLVLLWLTVACVYCCFISCLYYSLFVNV